jgi:hypothetical protein
MNIISIPTIDYIYTTSSVDQLLFERIGSYQLVNEWWNSPNRNLSMRKPIEVWNEDQDGPEQVYNIVLNLN